MSRVIAQIVNTGLGLSSVLCAHLRSGCERVNRTNNKRLFFNEVYFYCIGFKD